MNGGNVIGIVGGGQLGRMLTQAATSLGFRVVVVDPVENCPAAQVGAMQIVGPLNDEDALNKLAAMSDYLTVEIEHLAADILKKISALGKPVNAAPETIALIQDKFAQKEFLAEHGFPVADFREVESFGQAQDALKEFGGKMLLKTRRNAFDGRGNAMIRNAKELEESMRKFGGQALYAERVVDFKKELAAVVAKDINGQAKAYPLVQTVHERNICVEVLAPAPVDQGVSAKAISLATDLVSKLKGAGIYGVELFLLKDDSIVINEIAPRVHNSGHITLDACVTSQFEQHIRAITGLPLGSTELTTPAACMVNILGERNGETKIKGLEKALENPNVSVHLYGKSPTKIDRKMGHINVWGNTLDEVLATARKARKLIEI